MLGSVRWQLCLAAVSLPLMGQTRAHGCRASSWLGSQAAEKMHPPQASSRASSVLTALQVYFCCRLGMLLHFGSFSGGGVVLHPARTLGYVYRIRKM